MYQLKYSKKIIKELKKLDPKEKKDIIYWIEKKF